MAKEGARRTGKFRLGPSPIEPLVADALGGGGKDRPFAQQLFHDLNALVSTPLFNFIWSQIVAGKDQKALDEFETKIEGIQTGIREDEGGAMAGQLAATEQVVRQGLFDTQRFFGSAGERFAEVADPLTEDIGERTQLGIAGAQAIARDAAQRERDILREARGLGEAERGELNRRFGALGRTQQGRLAGLGLGGTLLSSGVASGVARAQGSEMSLLNARLQRERLGLSERLSADTLSARAGALEFQTGLRGEDITARGNLGFAGLEHTEQAELDRMAERERLGLLVPSLRRDQAERRTFVETELFQNQPPIPDPNVNQLMFSLGQS